MYNLMGLGFQQTCAIISTNFRTILSSHKETSCSLAVTPIFCHSPVLGNASLLDSVQRWAHTYMIFLTKFFNLIFITKEALLKDNTHLHANLDIEDIIMLPPWMKKYSPSMASGRDGIRLLQGQDL